MLHYVHKQERKLTIKHHEADYSHFNGGLVY